MKKPKPCKVCNGVGRVPKNIGYTIPKMAMVMCTNCYGKGVK